MLVGRGKKRRRKRCWLEEGKEDRRKRKGKFVGRGLKKRR